MRVEVAPAGVNLKTLLDTNPPGGLRAWESCGQTFPYPVDPVRAELERIAFAPAGSGRGALAKVTALRTLEKMERPVDDGSYPVDDGGRFFVGPPQAWDLYRCDSDETRER